MYKVYTLLRSGVRGYENYLIQKFNVRNILHAKYLRITVVMLLYDILIISPANKMGIAAQESSTEVQNPRWCSCVNKDLNSLLQ